MYLVSKGSRCPVNSLEQLEAALRREEPEYIDISFGVTRQAVKTLCKVFSLLPPERRASVICYVDSAGKLFARYRLLSRQDALKLGRAVLYYEAVGPDRRFGVYETDTAEEAVLKMAKFESLRVILAILGVLEIERGERYGEDERADEDWGL